MPSLRCLFSFTAIRDRCYRHSFAAAGLRSTTADLGGGTTINVWVPKLPPDPSRPSLVLLHGFGANTTWQWSDHLRPLLLAGFNLYVPDLVFFGGSHTARPDRSESFQAECVLSAMDRLGVGRVSVAGISYGGFVAYRMAAMAPGRVERVVLCCAGVCLEERDLEDGLFAVDDVEKAGRILLPQTPDKLRELMRLSFVKPPRALPSCFLSDYINVMCSEYVVEKAELIYALIKKRKLSELPKITQPTLIIWGEQDQIFPLELGHRLNRHLDENSELVIIRNAGHAVNLEKPKEFCKYMKAFLADSSNTSFSNRKIILASPSNNKLGKRVRSLYKNSTSFAQRLLP